MNSLPTNNGIDVLKSVLKHLENRVKSGSITSGDCAITARIIVAKINQLSISDSSSVLSNKEQTRLNTVKEMISETVSKINYITKRDGSLVVVRETPYLDTAQGALGSGQFIDSKDSDNSINKPLTPKERLQKFNTTVGSRKRRKYSLDTDIDPLKSVTTVVEQIIESLRCLYCLKPLEWVTSVYGKGQVGWTKIDVEKSIPDSVPNPDDLETTTITVRIPVFKTGNYCKTCADTLYVDYYPSWNKELRASVQVRRFEYKDEPKRKITEAVSKGNGRTQIKTVSLGSTVVQSKDDNLPRGREVVKSVTIPITVDKDGDVIEERRISNSRIRVDIPDEPISDSAFAYVTRPKHASGRVGTKFKSDAEKGNTSKLQHGEIKHYSAAEIAKAIPATDTHKTVRR